MDDCIRVPLTKGKVAYIDRADLHLVEDIPWYALLVGSTRRTNAKGKWYAAAQVKRDGKWKTIYMHRLIMGEPPGLKVDHRDGDGFNNRRSNLRAATHAQNIQASGLSSRPNKTSQFKGVSLIKRSGRWNAVLRADGRDHRVGVYDDEIEAAVAWDDAARRLHGGFAVTNGSLGLLPDWGEEI